MRRPASRTELLQAPALIEIAVKVTTMEVRTIYGQIASKNTGHDIPLSGKRATFLHLGDSVG